MASILELGSAFHGELTGRQNIVLNAAMFGLDRQQVIERTPGIIEFSELGHFIDQPIKTYSTGMVMRLGFAIATQVNPDVLIIDEALSVGDGYFQKKCMVHLNSYVENGGTLLICSHAMYYISAFCKRALWLHEGKVEALGPTQEVVPRYEAYLDSKTRSMPKRVRRSSKRLPAPRPGSMTSVCSPATPTGTWVLSSSRSAGAVTTPRWRSTSVSASTVPTRWRSPPSSPTVQAQGRGRATRATQ